MEDKSELEAVAIQIILHAGDARTKADEAFQCALAGDAAGAEAHLAEANSLIAQAHSSQTEVIQKEADGANYPYSLLFSHAQDTMMTIDLEIRQTRRMIEAIEAMRKEA